jgi:hypothetical protein
MKRTLLRTVVGGVLLCGMVMWAQEPVQDIDPNHHPNLAAAQKHVVAANAEITTAQKDNKYDMGGHAEKARQLLAQANQELKMAAEAASAAAAKKK